MHAIAARLPDGYSIQTAERRRSGQSEQLWLVFPIMIILTLITLMFQVRSFSEISWCFLTAPLGLVGVVHPHHCATAVRLHSIIGLIGSPAS